jgi:hypothetical protein
VAILLSVMGAGTAEHINGYAELRKPGILIVDGQRIRAVVETKFKGQDVKNLAAIPLGWEVEVTGVRIGDGSVLASSVSAKPNGVSLYENDVLKATNEIESAWVEKGMMYEPRSDGSATKIGEIHESGPKVDRVRRIMDRLRPPYVGADRLRVRVVETKEWNASAMGNGAIWVYTGLLNEMSDDEMSIVLGHELTHYTHEHSRRNAKRGMFTQLLGLGALAASSAIDNDAARTSAMLGSMLGMTAFTSGYSRDLEDQADRVGLRYAYEGGYDVTQGPVLWGKFKKKYGETDKVSNFFVGSHSRPSDRIRNINHELALNYPK